METRKSFMVHGATYRRRLEAQRHKPEPFSLTNWLADHPRMTALFLCSAIYVAGLADRVLG